SFIFTLFSPSFARPGTSTEVGGGKLNVYDAIKSRVVHADTFRARNGYAAALSPGPPVLGIFTFGENVRATLSSSYWPVKWTTAPASKPPSHVSAGQS